MPIQFEDAERPVAQRENEFREVVKFLAANEGAVKSYVIPANGREADDVYAHADADKRKMAEAGNELEPKRTIRTRNDLLDDGSIKVYFWATKKIARSPKNAAVTPGATAPVKTAAPAKK